MKVSGFTFIRNAIKFDYPIVEAVQSILPLCDEVVIAVGRSEDDTLGLISGIPSNKVRIIETIWDDSLREGGRVLALETDKAFRSISHDSDWAIYIQGDEILHEQSLAVVVEAMKEFKDDPQVDGLLFNYIHFYGSYDYVGDSYRWYRREIRAIKNRPDIFSYKDAQGFRKRPNEKLKVKHVNAWVYHYGWVKDPRKMQLKREDFHRFWKDDRWIKDNIAVAEEFDYSEIDSLKPFEGTHPSVMLNRIAEKNWKFTHDLKKNSFTFKEKLKRLVERIFGYRIGEYKNYKII